METRTGNTVLKLSDRETGELICKHCGSMVWGVTNPNGRGFMPGTFAKCPHCGVMANTIYEGEGVEA